MRELHSHKYHDNRISDNTATIITNKGSLKKRLENLANYTPTTRNTAIDKHDANSTNSNNTPLTCIVGDSIVKELKGWKINEKLDKQGKITVKSFSGVSTKCMSHHIKPTLSQKPDQVIIHIGTNDLPSNRSEQEFAASIINLSLMVG